MRVLFVSSEVYPLAKTGGLADVSESLPRALSKLGTDVRVLMPAYPSAKAQLPKAQVIADIGGILGVGEARLLSARIPSTEVPLWLIDAPELYDRQGLYQNAEGQDWHDNARRFAYLAHVAAEIAMGRAQTDWTPDIVHVNDWHAGLVPLLLSRQDGPKPASVFTMHNMAFQGNFPDHVLSDIGVEPAHFTADGIEYYGQASFLKAGIRYADSLTTVSPTYAREILTPEFGFGFEGLLRHRAADLTGILNGADYAIWDPTLDPFIPVNYDSARLNGKKTCKAVLQRELGLAETPDTPMLAFISRMTEQKMADVLLELLPEIANTDIQLVVLSDGDHRLEDRFQAAARHYPDKVAVRIGYEEPLAHRIQAGADILLAPARFEPCGLSQIYAMRYGTLPVVRATGGLADTVTDTTRATISDGTASGFVFAQADVRELGSAIARACAFYREPLAWRRLQLSAMKQDFGWDRSAEQYQALYRSLIEPSPLEDALETLFAAMDEDTQREQASA